MSSGAENDMLPTPDAPVAEPLAADQQAALDKELSEVTALLETSTSSADGEMGGIDSTESEGSSTPSEDGEIEKKNRSASYCNELIKKEMSDEEILSLIESEVSEIISEHEALNDYEVVFLYDYNMINRTHASSIYQRLSSLKKNNILLILKSPGGEVEPAYLISKLCIRLKGNKFIIGVPSEAKSAATLLSLGADEIHMGAMSELGPIDPQINGYPALAFSSALEKIAQLSEKYPGASTMLAQYLIGSKLDIQALGHYDRITESSEQYALRLLQSKATTTDSSGKLARLASYFTNHYKDHSFVIDVEEAQKLLGIDVVFSESKVYQACHEIHKFLEACEIIMQLRGHKRRITVLGSKFMLRKFP